MVKDAIPLGECARALVVKLRHHGDVLLATPVLSVLKAHAPRLEIDAQVDLRLGAPGPERLRRARVLEGEVADELGEDPDAGGFGACRKRRAGAGVDIGHGRGSGA